MSRYIDADALKEWLDEYLSVFKKYDKSEVKGFVDHAPTIEPKRGEWIDREQCQVDEDGYDVAICSNCKEEITIDPRHDNYCPNCGARMKGADDESKNHR